MTKSTITREQLEEWVAQFDEDGGCDATDRQLEALIRQSLAEMDGEPVAEVVSIYGDPEAFGEREIRPLVGIQQMPYGTKLYRHAQPAPKLKPVGYLFVSDQGAIAHSPTDWGMPGLRLAGQIFGDIDVELKPATVVPDSSVIGWIRADYQQDFQINCTAPHFIMGANDPSDAWGVKYMPVAKAGGPQNAPQNIPEIIPNELIAAVNRLLDSNGSRGCYNAIKCYDAHIEVERLLAAARQEVKP
ncbi:TPA: hypothetical protein ACTY9H_003278 [Klebsiella quasipneumoniae subsp. similipneumoniae]